MHAHMHTCVYMCVCQGSAVELDLALDLDIGLRIDLHTLHLWVSKGMDHGQVPEKLINYVCEGWPR